MPTPEYDKVYNDTISSIGRRSVDLVLDISRLEDKIRGLRLIIRNVPDKGMLFHNHSVAIRRWKQELDEELEKARERKDALDVLQRGIERYGIAEHPLNPGEPLPQEDTTEDDINQNPRRRVRLR